MKTFSKKELAVKAEEVLSLYPTQKKVFATTDGQVFLDKNRAELHAKPNKLTVFPFSKEEEAQEEPSQDAPAKNAKDTIADVKVMDSVEELQALVPGEERKTVLAAIQERIEELTKSNE